MGKFKEMCWTYLKIKHIPLNFWRNPIVSFLIIPIILIKYLIGNAPFVLENIVNVVQPIPKKGIPIAF